MEEFREAAHPPPPPGTEALEAFREEPPPPSPPPLRRLPRRLMELDRERMSSPRSNMAAAAAATELTGGRSPLYAGSHFWFA